VLRYYREYVAARGLSIKDMWKVMRGDGVDISYSRLRQRIRELRRAGRIEVRVAVKP